MKRSEKTRKLIVEKTAVIFNKKGYTGTYLSDLTEATGLTKGSIYGNFKDKNEVAVEAFRYNYQFQTEQLIPEIEKEVSAVDKLLAFVRYYRVNYQRIFENGGCAILNTATDVDDGNEILKSEVVNAIHRWYNKLVEILSDGIENNEIKRINITDFSYRIISLVEGSILLAKTLNKPDILLDNMDYLEKEIQGIKLV